MALPYRTTVTMTGFPPARPVGLAVTSLVPFALARLVSISLGNLRAPPYALGGDRPSKLPTSQCPVPDQRTRLDTKIKQGGISPLPPPELAPGFKAPPILHSRVLVSLAS